MKKNFEIIIMILTLTVLFAAVMTASSSGAVHTATTSAPCAFDHSSNNNDAHQIASCTADNSNWTCTKCNGTGNCWVCNGNGKATNGEDCSMCQGSCKCYYCSGKGKI